MALDTPHKMFNFLKGHFAINKKGQQCILVQQCLFAGKYHIISKFMSVKYDKHVAFHICVILYYVIVAILQYNIILLIYKIMRKLLS